MSALVSVSAECSLCLLEHFDFVFAVLVVDVSKACWWIHYSLIGNVYEDGGRCRVLILNKSVLSDALVDVFLGGMFMSLGSV